MSGLSLRHGWSNVIVALGLAIIPFLMFAPLKHGERTAKADPTAMASVEIVQR